MQWSPRRARKPSPQYARVFTALAAGGYLLVTGVIGYDVRHLHGLFRGGKWIDAPIWSQVVLGIAVLLLAGFWIRRLPSSSWLAIVVPRRVTKHAGSGTSEGARQSRRRLLP